MKVLVYNKISGEEPVTNYINTLNAKFKAKVLWEIGYGIKLYERLWGAIW